MAVIEQLAQSGDEDAVGPLIFALKDKDAGVRCAAAKALMKFQDRRAVEPLIQMLRDAEALARAAAAEALGQLNDPLAVNQLVGLLRDGDPIVRTVVARSLERLGWHPGTDSQRVLQILAMGNLNQLVALGPEGVAPLLDLLRQGSPNKQFSAVKALSEINDPRVKPAMVEALSKPSPAVRIAALGALERIGDANVFHDVEKLLQDPEASVRGAAVEAASRCGREKAVPALIKRLKDSSWEVRQAAANALGNLGDANAVEALTELLGDPDRDVREKGISALANLHDRRAIPALVIGLFDEESTVRNLATAALSKLDRRWIQYDGIRRVVPKMEAAQKHADYWVRHTAGQLLEKLKAEAPHILEAAPVAPPAPVLAEATAQQQHPATAVLADMLFDRDPDIRLAAACAFCKLREKSAAGLLSAALRDSDELVRNTAQQALNALN